RRGAGAALVPVGLELVVVLAVPYRLARLLDQRQLVFRHGPDVGVGPRRGQLHDGPGFEEAGIVVRVGARDLEVLERPRRLDAVVGVGRYLLLSQQVVLDSVLLLGPGRESEENAQDEGDGADTSVHGQPPGRLAAAHERERSPGHRIHRARARAARVLVALATSPGSMKLWLSR